MPETGQWKKAKGTRVIYNVPRKQCEAVNCGDFYQPTWHVSRRCNRCKRENRPYRDEDLPF